jgi:hypothetical protein
MCRLFPRALVLPIPILLAALPARADRPHAGRVPRRAFVR